MRKSRRGDQRPVHCNTAYVVGRLQGLRTRIAGAAGVRGQSTSEQGAIMMLIAVFAGAGVLLAVMAMGIETGRVYLMRNQVQSAGDSTIIALAEQCKGNVLGVSNKCNTATSLYSMARASVNLAGSNGNAITLVGVCVDTSTATSVRCSTSLSGPDNSSPGTLDDTCAALPSGTDRYVRVIVERTSAYAGLFMPSSKLRQCVQAKWSTGTSQNTPMPFVFPACSYEYDDDEWVLIMENESQGGGLGSRNPQNCTVNWTATATQNFNFAPITVSSVDKDDPVYSGKACGDNVLITLGSILTMGNLIQATCPSSEDSIDDWMDDSDEARWVPIAGNYQSDSWNVEVVAFAKFDLWAYNPANDDDWLDERSGWSVPDDIDEQCQAPKKLTCVYGKWVSGTLQYAGNSSAVDGIEILP